MHQVRQQINGNHFLKYIRSITGEDEQRGNAIEKRHCSHLKPKLFFFSSLLRVANVHRLRTPCPRRGIVKYYTGAGGDIGGVTVSNFSSLFLPRYIARCIASVSEMQIAGRSPMACFRYPPFRAVILIGELLSNSLPWLVHEPRFA